MCTVKDVFENLQEESDFLEESTRKQSNTQTWYDHRKGRITASHFHDVLRYKGKTYPKSIVKAIMQYYGVGNMKMMPGRHTYSKWKLCIVIFK